MCLRFTQKVIYQLVSIPETQAPRSNQRTEFFFFQKLKTPQTDTEEELAKTENPISFGWSVQSTGFINRPKNQ